MESLSKRERVSNDKPTFLKEKGSSLAIAPESCYTLSEKGIQMEIPFLSEND